MCIRILMCMRARVGGEHGQNWICYISPQSYYQWGGHYSLLSFNLFAVKSGQKTLTSCVRNIFESFTLDTLGTHIKNKFILWIYELPVELIDGFCTYFHVLMISLVRVKGITVFLLILYVLFLTVFRGNPR